MFKYALKSMVSRKVTTLLFALALVVALSISMISVNISSQITEGFYKSDNQYDVLIGPKGSDTQLVLSSMFFSELPLGTIPYEYAKELQAKGNLQQVIPFALSDNYMGSYIVGTKPEFLDGRKMAQGKNFTAPFEVVVGYAVAKKLNMQLGDSIVSSHGLITGGDEHTNSPFIVVGILEKTATAYDNVLFSDIAGVWTSHKRDADATPEEKADKVTAILVRTGNLALASQMLVQFNNKGDTQAINPTTTMRKLMTNIDLSKQVAILLVGIILVLALIIILIMSMILLESTNKEVKTLRIIGMSKKSITKFVLHQIITLVVIGSMLSICVSRASLYIANSVSSKLGLVIDVTKIYKAEFEIIALVIVLCISPIIIYMLKVFREEA